MIFIDKDANLKEVAERNEVINERIHTSGPILVVDMIFGKRQRKWSMVTLFCVIDARFSM